MVFFKSHLNMLQKSFKYPLNIVNQTFKKINNYPTFTSLYVLSCLRKEYRDLKFFYCLYVCVCIYIHTLTK